MGACAPAAVDEGGDASASAALISPLKSTLAELFGLEEPSALAAALPAEISSLEEPAASALPLSAHVEAGLEPSWSWIGICALSVVNLKTRQWRMRTSNVRACGSFLWKMLSTKLSSNLTDVVWIESGRLTS